MKRDLEKLRAWERRSRKPLATGQRLRRGTPLNPANKARRRKRYERDFGSHADWIRSLPCIIDNCVGGPIQACHAVSRGAGGDRRALVPMCSQHHLEQHRWGVLTFQAHYGVDLRYEASRLWRLNGLGVP